MYFCANVGGGCNHSWPAGTDGTSMPAAPRGQCRKPRLHAPEASKCPLQGWLLWGPRCGSPPAPPTPPPARRAEDIRPPIQQTGPKILAPTQTPSVQPGTQQHSLEPPKPTLYGSRGARTPDLNPPDTPSLHRHPGGDMQPPSCEANIVYLCKKETFTYVDTKVVSFLLQTWNICIIENTNKVSLKKKSFKVD